MKENPLLRLEELGQSIWLDYTRRDLIETGALRRLIEKDGLRGMTSNPSIFEKAILTSGHYEEDIRTMALHRKSPGEIYESLSHRDVQAAADEFRRVYDKEGGEDGFVSLEVNPHLAHDTKGTLEEARRLWRAINRPNVFIKVPATAEGLPAIQQLTTEGINVNVTLLFGLSRYRQVAEAYLGGLEARAAEGKPLGLVASVASFFLSRIDSIVDPLLERVITGGGKTVKLAQSVRGQAAIASARVAYQIYKELCYTERFQRLAEQGARSQRLLWASTSTKNPAYSDLKYVEALILPDTISTVTVETLDAYRDHGNPKVTFEPSVTEAKTILEQLRTLDVDLDRVTEQLESEGIAKFDKAFDQIIAALSEKIRIAS